VKQRAGEVLVLNDVGARVMDLAEAGESIAGMVSVLAAEYDVAAPVLERDLLAYLQELLDAEVIEPVDAPSGKPPDRDAARSDEEGR